jgi:aminoglycoside phosphotransferase (APT) family kinase protein
VHDDFEGGWDNRVVLVDGRWVQRTPRFPDREPQLRREAALLPWLGPLVPLPVPRPEVVSDDPLTVRHAYLPGGPCPGTEAPQGAAVGAFLRVLHALDPQDALRHGARDAASWHGERVASLALMTDQVLPLLPARLRPDGEALLGRLLTPPADPCLVHGDLGREHLRVENTRVTGVIDWGDSGLGDASIDLAWTVFGTSPAFAEAVVAAYGADEALLARGRDFHRVGPWHEILYGLGPGGPAYIESGLAGAVSRLDGTA